MAPAPPPTNTGEPCAYCHHADLLPLTCHHCHARLCAAHAPPSNHACPADPALAAPLAPRPQPRPRAATDSPTLKSLVPDPDRHARARDTEPSAAHDTALRARQLAALAKFKANASSARSSSSAAASPTSAASRPPLKPAKKAPSPAVALMRLKQRAVALDPRHAKRPGDVPLGERRFFYVRIGGEDESEAGEASEVWAAKSISGGKALDLAADLLKVANRNHLTTDPAQRLSLALAHPTGPGPGPLARVDLAAPLAAQVPDGACVVLLAGHAWQ